MDRAKLGDVEISVVVSEKPSNRAEITEKPVEKGQDVADHVKTRPATLDLVGAVIGDGASDKLQKLKKYQRDGILVKYVHRTSYSNMVIEEIGTTHNAKIGNGFEFNIRLKHVRIASAKEVEIAIVNPATKKPNPKTSSQVKPPSNNGLQQPTAKTTQVNMLMERDAAKRRELSNPAKEDYDKFVDTYVQPGGTMKVMRELMELYKSPVQSKRVNDLRIAMN